MSVIAALALFLIPGGAASLAYNRALPHEFWRVFTCHWVHWNAEHLFWCTVTFLALGVLCEREHPGRFLACIVVAAFAIPMSVHLVSPGLTTYGGLSGLASALFTLLAVTFLRQNVSRREWLWVAGCGGLLAAFALKVAYECSSGAAVFVTDTQNMTPVPIAHVVGGLIGLVFAIRSQAATRPPSTTRAKLPFAEASDRSVGSD